MLDETLFRQLFNESEGTRLDFKVEQYKFEGADDDEKSKLLKDVLAFANSSRSETAYIIIGVSDGEPGTREMLGIDDADHIDDAKLQQFINSKINRPITFSYRSFIHDGKTYGVYEIPVQERPFYAKKDFAGVKQGVIYYRLGSSCAVATPEDVALMGRDDAARRMSRPLLTAHFADTETRERIGEELPLSVTCHAPHNPKDIPDHRDSPRTRQVAPGFVFQMPQAFSGPRAREEFWRELADHLRDQKRFAPVLIAIHNPSAVMASSVQVEVRIPVQGLETRELDDLPEFPDSHFDLMNPRIPQLSPPYSPSPSEFTVCRRGEVWLLVAEFDGVRPRQTVTVQLPVYVAPDISETIKIDAKCYAAELPEPSHTTLTLRATVEQRPPLQIEDLKQFRFERYERRLKDDGVFEDNEPDEQD